MRKMLLTIGSGALIACASSTLADEAIQRCALARQNDSRASAIQPATELLARNDLSGSDLDVAKSCVELAYPGKYSYLPEKGFLSKFQISKMEKQKKAEQLQADKKAALKRFRQREEEKRRAVISLLIKACANKFRHSPEEAILIDACYQVFMEQGLPN